MLCKLIECVFLQLETEQTVAESERLKLATERDVLEKSHQHTKTDLTASDNKLQDMIKQVEWIIKQAFIILELASKYMVLQIHYRCEYTWLGCVEGYLVLWMW